jgi:hypothetical protein
MSGLPERPDLDQLRRQARELLRAAADGEPRAVDRLRAVSPHVALSAAQLALAREHGFQSWAALKTEVARRRSPAEPAERWSFGGAAALQTPAGVLVPEILIAGAEQAVLYGSLTLSGNGQLTAPAARRQVPATPGALLAQLVPRRTVVERAGQRRRTIWHWNPRETRRRWAEADADSARMRGLLDSTTIVDDRGTQYAHEGAGMSGKRGTPDKSVYLRVDPVPGREIEWIELHGQDGTAARLLPSPRAAARIGQLGPARVTAAGPPAMPGAMPRAGGPQFYRDIGIALPAVDGVSIRLDSLISLPGRWLLYLCATPSWRTYGPAGRFPEDPVPVHAEDDRVSVHAEDDHGGSYVGSYARNRRVLTPEETALLNGPEETARESFQAREDLALELLPRLDPLARAVKLTFQGAHEEITVDLEIGTT